MKTSECLHLSPSDLLAPYDCFRAAVSEVMSSTTSQSWGWALAFKFKSLQDRQDCGKSNLKTQAGWFLVAHNNSPLGAF
jgi:hypothetical protein